MIPQVSMVVAARNNGRFVREAVESLIGEGIEVVVVDDASADETPNILSALPVKFLRNGSRKGISNSRNLAISAATGRYIGFLDSDDRLVPGGIRWRLEWLEEHPLESAVMGSIASIIDADGAEIRDRWGVLESYRALPSQILRSEVLDHRAHLISPLSTTLFRAEALRLIGPFDESLPSAQDRELMIRFLGCFNVFHISRDVIDYRVHGGNMSINTDLKAQYTSRMTRACTFLVDRQYQGAMGGAEQ